MTAKVILAASAALFISGCALLPVAMIAIPATEFVTAKAPEAGVVSGGFQSLCKLGGGATAEGGDCIAPWSDAYPD